MHLQITNQITIPEHEIELTAIRAQGAGGQNVNKVSSAIHLRFDINTSSLPAFCKQKLLKIKDQRISKDGVIIIKSQQYRTQEKNREAALQRLSTLIHDATKTRKKRMPTRPTKSSQKKRMDNKTKRGRIKELRKKTGYEE